MSKILLPTCIWFDLKNAKLSSVKQFTALSILVLVFLCGSLMQAQAQESCAEIFIATSAVSKRDTLESTRTYYKFINQFGKKAPGKVTVTATDGTQNVVKTPAELHQILNPVKILDIGTMGVLGKIFDLKWNKEVQKNIAEKNDFFYKTEIDSAKKILDRAPMQASTRFTAEVQDLLQVEKLSGGVVFLSIDLGKPLKTNQGEIIHAIRQRFALTYVHLVNWSYRISGLEKNKALSNMTMMDEMGALAADGHAFKLNLILDESVWNAQLRILEGRAQEYSKEVDSKTKKVMLDDISQPIDPFLPLAGVAVSYDMRNPGGAVEMKRYFKNDFEDPLGMLHIPERNEFVVRHKMLYSVIEKLAPHQVMEIHAHTAIHVRAYAKLGFKKAETIENPLYPGVQVYVLRATREDALVKIGAILNQE